MPTHDEDIEAIREEIEKRESCRATHSGTIICEVAFEGRFKAPVETFELMGRPAPAIVYGWKMPQHRRTDAAQIFIFPHSGLVNSPEAALKRGIIQIYLKTLEDAGL